MSDKYSARCEWVESQLPELAVVCNCASCGMLLVVSGVHAKDMHKLERLAGKVYERPYCRKCIRAARAKPLPPENQFRTPDPE